MSIVNWTKKALKQLKVFPQADRATIHAAAGKLQDWPNCRNVKALVDMDAYRLRVGRYRIIFTVQEGKPLIVTIEEVKKRDERTYQ